MQSALRVVLCLAVALDAVSASRKVNQFPPDFYFSAATASYQVEGAWNTSHKGENIWDRLAHEHPDWIADGTNGDVAADSYHLYREDIKALKELGMNFYRFSLSWGRILPTGEVDFINVDGINYYNNLIDELLRNNIQPMVTLYHWDLPQRLEDMGGWPNPIMQDFFVDYARVAFTYFGDRVKWWITFNEPTHVSAGYADGHQFAPGLEVHGVADYYSTHTILQAHARVYELYHQSFGNRQEGKVGITLYSLWYEPLTDTPADVEAANRGLQFDLGWFAHPIFSREGNYPRIMRERVDINSFFENRTHSRLPIFTKEWVKRIRGSFDFFGLNHYTTSLTTSGDMGEEPSRARDSGAVVSDDPNWPVAASEWLKVVPWGLRKMLNFIKNEYNNPPVFITENGYSDYGELNDTGRVNYYSGYISELLRAMNEDNCNVIGYTAWSLIDNYEWTSGYTRKFGVYSVDYNDAARPRTAKSSARLFQKITTTKALPLEYFRPSQEPVVKQYVTKGRRLRLRTAFRRRL